MKAQSLRIDWFGWVLSNTHRFYRFCDHRFCRPSGHTSQKLYVCYTPLTLSLSPSPPLSLSICSCVYLSHLSWSVIGKAIYPFPISDGWFPRSFEMGRVKLKIKRLENVNGRQATYAKRKHGIMKKANELSILCDVDIVLIMFSPSGKPFLYKGKNSSIEGVIEKFSQLTPQERAKRKLESLEALKKTFKKLDHNVNIQDFIGARYQSTEDLMDQANYFRTQLSDLHERLSYWNNPDKIECTEKLGQMEESLRESLDQIRRQKESFGKELILDQGCTNQLQNGMHPPFSLDTEQQVQLMTWMPNNDSQQLYYPKDSNLFPKSEMDYNVCTSYGSYAGYLGKSENADIACSSGQENRLVDMSSQSGNVHGEFYQPCPYPQNNFSFLYDNKKFQPAQQMSLQKPDEYCFDVNFEPLRSGYDTTYCNWASTLDSSAAAPFGDRLYPQQHLTDDHMAKELGYVHQPSLTN